MTRPSHTRAVCLSRRLSAILLAVGGLVMPVHLANGQGCIVARSSSTVTGPETEGGYLSKGEWDITIGFRHQYSFRHFVGDVEQKHRMQQGTQVMNKINLLNVNVTYQATPRFSFTASAPVLFSSRRSNNSPYTTSAQGFGDAYLSGQGWLWSPQENKKGNIGIGLGAIFPTGKDNVTNRIDAFDGRGPRDVTLDYSVQPGAGGYGILFQWQSFKNLGTFTQIYLNGSYIATPQNTNDFLRNTTTTNPLTQYNSISDQYLVEAGVARSVRQVRGLTVIAGPRWEGVPAKDLIGDSLGFRRPGYAISIEAGFQYSHGKNLLAFTGGKAIHRDRTRSVPDRISGSHGDAAFADYLWLASYSFRFGGQSSHKDPPAHSMNLPHYYLARGAAITLDTNRSTALPAFTSRATRIGPPAAALKAVSP